METRASARRAAEQRLAAEELAQNWLQRQGPYAAAALAQIQRNNQETYGYDRFGYDELELGPVARATHSTFAGLSPHNSTSAHVASTCKPKTAQKAKRSLSFFFYNNDECGTFRALPFLSGTVPLYSSIEPSMKQRRITRSYSQRRKVEAKTNLFESALEFVFEGGYLQWYECMRLRGVNRGCLALWHEKRETAGPWNLILKEINALNGTNKCNRCEQVILLKNNRHLCFEARCMPKKSSNGEKQHRTRNHVWDEVSSKRTPDFVSCIDILMSSGVLTWRERGGIRRICKATYKVHKEYCTCVQPVDRSTSLPFVKIDPRYQIGYYEDWSDYERCIAMKQYTLTLKNNLHSFYNFHHVTDPDSLPYGLARWNWFDMQMVNLQSNCPKRYALTMHLVSLFIAQGELQRFPPVWYADAFVGTQHRPYADSFVESLASAISDYCLPGK